MYRESSERLSLPIGSVVPPAGFEPAISGLKGRCPRPLDDGGGRQNGSAPAPLASVGNRSPPDLDESEELAEIGADVDWRRACVTTGLAAGASEARGWPACTTGSVAVIADTFGEVKESSEGNNAAVAVGGLC